MIEYNESDFYRDDETCIHCDYTINYYDEVKEEAMCFVTKWNAENPDDQMQHPEDWKDFSEEAIEQVVSKYRNIRTVCDCCYDNED